MLIHSVYFWFKPNADPATAARFEAGLARLNTIADVKEGHFGKPAPTPQRPVIDDSYTWGLIVTFADLDAHDRYQAHPVHQDFVEEFSPLWDRVQVFDVRI